MARVVATWAFFIVLVAATIDRDGPVLWLLALGLGIALLVMHYWEV